MTGAPLAYTPGTGPAAADHRAPGDRRRQRDTRGATVALSLNYLNGEDVLAFGSQNGITGVFRRVDRRAHAGGNRTVAQYQAALRSGDLHEHVSRSVHRDAPRLGRRQ
jgi:hypothetical protein